MRAVKMDGCTARTAATTMTDTTCPCVQTRPARNARGGIDATTGLMLAGWGRRAGQAFADGLVLVIPVLLRLLALLRARRADHRRRDDARRLGALLRAAVARTRGQRSAIAWRSPRARCSDRPAHHASLQAFKRWAFVSVYVAFRSSAGPFVPILFYLAALIDCLYPLYDKRNQTVHDKFAGTIIVIA